ncbi:unnamed protein product [Trifolium pratense]|uniref:Uncharacterized protein n=2 Tax=Trifolium pratense TaxID=57577 RepID=A0ACB0JDR9_TRIPR|nr:unnamed protein product [Trifolium pratense]CAJ2642396.1 unnamed protein product [Trifolium pratense]
MDFEFLDDLAIEGQLRITSQLIEVRLPLIHSRPSAAAKMATSDLLNELTKPTFMTDPDLELKLKIINIQQLDDAAGDVSGLAVKWFLYVSIALVDSKLGAEGRKDLFDWLSRQLSGLK